jgi:phosphotriesterase-related protein
MVDPRLFSLMPSWSYLHIHDEVLPYVRERGVTEEQITTMLVDNPRRYFENNIAY